MTEATTALACASGKTNLTVQAKREIGKFYENLTGGIYKEIFNSSVSGAYVWNCVRATRGIEKALTNMISQLPKRSGRKYGLLVHGNRIITMIVMKNLGLKSKAMKPDFTTDEAELENAVINTISVLQRQLDVDYPDAMMGTLFKNQSKCRNLVQNIV